MAAAYMRVDTNGVGSQVISDTQLTLRLSPYPPRASITSTLTLVATGSASITPSLMVSFPGQTTDSEFAMLRRPDGSYLAEGVFYGQPGQWRMRVDVYLGTDPAPANMLMLLDVR